MIELLERLGASAVNAILINEEELTDWPDEAVAALKAQKTANQGKTGHKRNLSRV